MNGCVMTHDTLLLPTPIRSLVGGHHQMQVIKVNVISLIGHGAGSRFIIVDFSRHLLVAYF